MNRSNPITTAAPHVPIPSCCTDRQRKSQKNGASFLPRTVLSLVLGLVFYLPQTELLSWKYRFLMNSMTNILGAESMAG